MVMYEAVIKLAKLEAAQAERRETNAARRDAVARGVLRCNMARREAEEAYWERVIPALQELADVGDSHLMVAIEEAEINAPE